ncbi:YjbH domain-containing protein [Thermodesulfobacteriota bacterium]
MTNPIPASNFLKKAALFFNFLILLQAILLTAAFSWDRPFNNAANWGGTGLMEIPTARILEDGDIRIGYAQASPYRWYTGGMGIFPGLEFSGRYTEITNVPTNLGDDFGAYKDKAFDLKYQILPESRILPAIAVGLHDFHGTRLFPSEYLVISRQIFPFDFSIGLGTDRLKGPATLPFWDEVGLFGGVEWAIHPRLHFLVEYNPIEYEKDRKKGVPEGSTSPVNVGFRINMTPQIGLGVSWQRGDTLGLMCHLQLNLGEPMTSKRPDPPLWTSIDRRPLNKRDPKEMVQRIQAAMKAAGFQNVSVYTNGDTLTAEFENTKYLSNQKAAGRVLRILLFHSPVETQKLSAVFKRRQMPFLKVSVSPEHLEKFIFDEIPENVFFEILSVETVAAHTGHGQQNFFKTEETSESDTSWGVKPMFQPYLNDPSGVFKFRAGIQPWATATIWKGGTGHFRYSIPFYSDVTSSNIPLPDAARSDSWKYLDDDLSLNQLFFDQVFRLSKKTFGRVSAGYFESMYAGVNGEILHFWGDGRLALGVEGDWVRKREPGISLGMTDFEYHTILGNIFYYIPGVNITLNAKYGRFLAGDVGWRLQLGREYENGLAFGFWYSFTDTDDLEPGYNKGYHDKGVFITIPARMFYDYETNVKYGYAISPWTRDVAATVYHRQRLYNLGTDLMPVKFRKNLEKIKE